MGRGVLVPSKRKDLEKEKRDEEVSLGISDGCALGEYGLGRWRLGIGNHAHSGHDTGGHEDGHQHEGAGIVRQGTSRQRFGFGRFEWRNHARRDPGDASLWAIRGHQRNPWPLGEGEALVSGIRAEGRSVSLRESL